jgi:hypothetical protein
MVRDAISYHAPEKALGALDCTFRDAVGLRVIGNGGSMFDTRELLELVQNESVVLCTVI